MFIVYAGGNRVRLTATFKGGDLMLERNVTLRDLWNRKQLSGALKYLDAILDRHKELHRDLGECTISIGLIGTGYGPNYRLRPINKIDVGSFEDLARTGAAREGTKEGKYIASLTRAYSGRSHKPLSAEIGARDEENWSDPPMSVADVLHLRNDVSQTEKSSAKSKRRGSI
jgi:hypothetical protein